MKKLIYNTENIILGSAVINPRLSRNLDIVVKVLQAGEGPIPHVNVYHDKTLNNKRCSIVRLDKAEYSGHNKDNIPLPRDLKEQFIYLMKSPWETRTYRETGYEASVDTWVDTYEDVGL